jgi:hypothetical protein
MNPYGQDAFFTKDSGGFLYDLPYAPANIVGVLGPCRSVMAQARIILNEHSIVPEEAYDEFLAGVTDPYDANFWDVVFDLPRTKRVRMEHIDNAYSLYEMANGAQGACHVGRIYHPTLPGGDSGALRSDGRRGGQDCGAPCRSRWMPTHKKQLPRVDADGWYHIPRRGDVSKAKFPKPTPGAFHYYHASTQHFIDCILEDREPVVGLDWGLHLTEMMYGTEESARTGARYEMTTTLPEAF